MTKEKRKNDEIILEEIKTFKEEFIKHKATVEIVLLGADGQSGICAKVNEHEKQINVLKNWRASVIGAATLISIILGYIFKNL